MVASEKHILDLQNVSKRYDGKTILDNINLYIREGEFVTLLGPSGCGTTTTLRLIAGFIQPDDGKILLEGEDIAGIPPYQRPLNTVFQRYALFPHLDVYDNIAFGLKLQKTPTDEIDRRVRKVLKMVAMTDYEDRDVDSLSGGQQQRVAIARALVNEPKVLLLDEPLSALDRKMREDMQIELKEMHQKLGITFIYVTHDQEEALTLSDTIVVMNEGRIQQIGTPTEIYNEPVNCFVADFIGESNILDGTFIKNGLVEFIGHEFECVDKGFGRRAPVDVVVRPEDVYIRRSQSGTQFSGTVRTCTFKGVHNEIFVDTDEGYEMMIQDYNAFEPGERVHMLIKPEDIQVMRKECTSNVLSGTVRDAETVRILGGDFPVANSFEVGSEVKVEVPFDGIELMDNLDDGVISGEVHSILYKGNHYHLTVRTEDGDSLYVDTNDIWDKGDLVGVKFIGQGIKLSKAEDETD